MNQQKERKRGYFKDTKEYFTFFCSSGLAALQAFHFSKSQFSESFICIKKNKKKIEREKERAWFLIYFGLNDEFLCSEIQ